MEENLDNIQKILETIRSVKERSGELEFIGFNERWHAQYIGGKEDVIQWRLGMFSRHNGYKVRTFLKKYKTIEPEGKPRGRDRYWMFDDGTKVKIDMLPKFHLSYLLSKENSELEIFWNETNDELSSLEEYQEMNNGEDIRRVSVLSDYNASELLSRINTKTNI
jgi:hypothetical protein